MKFNLFRWETALAFVIVLFPFSYFSFTSIGLLVEPYFLAGFQFLWKLLNLHQAEISLTSDTIPYFTWIFITFLLGWISSIFIPQKFQKITIQFAKAIFLWFLILILFRYGWDKIMLLQFPYPPDNILHTPFGSLDSDIAFWTLMGKTTVLSISLGIIEIGIGLLLLFSKTRNLGLILASVTFIVIFGINLFFGISVKGLSLLCFLLAFTLSFPTWQKLYLILFNKEVSATKTAISLIPFQQVSWRNFIRLSGICLLILETGYQQLFPLESTSYFNQKQSYHVVGNRNWRKVFIHSDNYLIMQDSLDQMHSFLLQKSNTDMYFFEEKPKRWKPIWLEINENKQQIQSFSLDSKVYYRLISIHSQE